VRVEEDRSHNHREQKRGERKYAPLSSLVGRWYGLMTSAAAAGPTATLAVAAAAAAATSYETVTTTGAPATLAVAVATAASTSVATAAASGTVGERRRHGAKHESSDEEQGHHERSNLRPPWCTMLTRIEHESLLPFQCL
jgi:hypothetical protein